MPKKKYWNSKKTLQIPLLDIIRIKKIGITSRGIKRLKLHLHREGAKILSIIIKPTNKTEGEKKNWSK